MIWMNQEQQDYPLSTQIGGKDPLGLISFCVWKKSHLLWKANYKAKNFISICETLAKNLTFFYLQCIYLIYL